MQVPLGRVPTLYARIGDLFPWLCVAGLVVAVGFATIGHRESTTHELSDGVTRPLLSTNVEVI